MSGYTIQDIDVIRKKSGISYQEAVALLEDHNGNLAHALIDLERNGKLRQEETTEKKKAAGGKKSVMSFLQTLYRMRFVIRREHTDIVNLSVIYCAICLIFAPYLVIFSCVLALILGYRFSFTRHDTSFDKTDLEDTFHHAADNVKSSIGDMTRGFTDAFSGQSAKTTETENTGSFYSARENQQNGFKAAAPEIHTPRKVQSQDGSVSFEENGDGYASATIE